MCVVLAMAYSLTRSHLRTQAALRDSEEKYRLLINSVPDTIYTVDPQGIILSISHACLNLFGYRQEEMLGQSFIQYVHPEAWIGRGKPSTVRSWQEDMPARPPISFL